MLDTSTSFARVSALTRAPMCTPIKVTLVSPSVALMQSVDDAGNRRGIDALLELAKVAPKYFPDAATELQAFKQTIENVPPRARWKAHEQREYEAIIDKAKKLFSPIHEELRERADKIHAETGFDQLQLAVNAGILTIERMADVDVSEIGDSGDTMVLGFLDRIQKLFETRNEYPLFDANASSIVTGGLEMGRAHQLQSGSVNMPRWRTVCSTTCLSSHTLLHPRSSISVPNRDQRWALSAPV